MVKALENDLKIVVRSFVNTNPDFCFMAVHLITLVLLAAWRNWRAANAYFKIQSDKKNVAT